MTDHNYFANLIWQIADLLRGGKRRSREARQEGSLQEAGGDHHRAVQGARPSGKGNRTSGGGDRGKGKAAEAPPYRHAGDRRPVRGAGRLDQGIRPANAVFEEPLNGIDQLRE